MTLKELVPEGVIRRVVPIVEHYQQLVAATFWRNFDQMADRTAPSFILRVDLFFSFWVPDDELIPYMNMHEDRISGTVILVRDLIDYNDSRFIKNSCSPRSS